MPDPPKEPAPEEDEGPKGSYQLSSLLSTKQQCSHHIVFFKQSLLGEFVDGILQCWTDVLDHSEKMYVALQTHDIQIAIFLPAPQLAVRNEPMNPHFYPCFALPTRGNECSSC